MNRPYGHHPRSASKRSHVLVLAVAVGGLFIPTLVPNLLAESPLFGKASAVLEQHCLECHNENIQKGGLSLATREGLLKGGDSGAAFAEGEARHPLLEAVSGEEPDMPKDGDPLSDEEVAVLDAWITAGAPWNEGVVLLEPSKADKSWWAYQPIPRVVTPPPPHPLLRAWAKNPIDGFILAQLSENGLGPNPPASPEDLIRRVTYDLTGLPPTPDEIRAFSTAWAAQGDAAYEALVDRLLASPRYGERWGRHWLDVVRFGESRGFERNLINDSIWPFRDYVIKSFNENKPFDRFIMEHIAGDVIGKDQPEVEVATAFLVAGPFDDVGNQDPKAKAQIRANTLDDVISATGSAFLGMTLSCARCHDHKFDPIRQADYYRVRSAFEGVQWKDRVIATAEERKAHDEARKPLEARQAELEKTRREVENRIVARVKADPGKVLPKVNRPKVDRTFTEDRFEPVEVLAVRLVPLTDDRNPKGPASVRIDEFEIWTAGKRSRNVALASGGAKAAGDSRKVEDAAANAEGAYSAKLAIDGKFGRRWISAGNHTLTITLPHKETIDRVVFSSDRPKDLPSHNKMVFVGEYRLEVSQDGKVWKEVSNSWDREPINETFERHRMLRFGTLPEEAKQLAEVGQQLGEVRRSLAEVEPLERIWAGQFQQPEEATQLAKGGDPNKPVGKVAPGSLTTLSEVTDAFELAEDAPESERRLALAKWMVQEDNPVTPRVLANRLWHYHFGTGIVSTPSDFGYMGGRPSHPELLDWLARRLLEPGWRLKPLHREILLSRTYRQSSDYREEAAAKDQDAHLLWRFPPRRLSAEELRDSMLLAAGKLGLEMGGPGFRLYQFTQDNVCTYHPLDTHDPETYRRAVYHQNPRAAKLDLLTEFDAPDCAFPTPRRASTTTPLQALTLMNHSFTLDMAKAFASRLVDESPKLEQQVENAFLFAFGRTPAEDEADAALALTREHGLEPLCRALLNANEFVFLR